MKEKCFLHGEYELAPDGAPTVCPKCFVQMQESPTCTWTWDDDVCGGHWDTECGEGFCFENDEKPGEKSRIKYCCYCGKKIRAVESAGDELQSDDLLP